MSIRLLGLSLWAASFAWGQTAISSLTSFWEPGTSDRIMWDHKGNAQGMYVGLGYQTPGTIFGAGFSRAAGTQVPQNSGAMAVPASLVDTGGGSWCYAAWIIPGTSASDMLLSQWGVTSPTVDQSWRLNYQTGSHLTLAYGMTDGSTAALSDTAATVTAGTRTLVWIAFNSSDGSIKVAQNGDTWASVSPSHPFVNLHPHALDVGHILDRYFATDPVFGRMMFWNGYVPTDAEKTAIYNGGTGQDQAYFGLSYIATVQPLTVTLQNSTFADDSILAYQGLYWLRPYPLKTWNPTLAASLGNYVWFRGSDHAVISTDRISMGFSASPDVLPTTWTQPLGISELQTAAGGTWVAAQNPWAEYNPDTGKIHLYWNAIYAQRGATYSYVEPTWVWTTSDLSTWTYGGNAFPVTQMFDGCAVNFTGYATPHWISANNWTAQTLLNDSTSSCDANRYGQWTSTDGLTWTLNSTAVYSDVTFPYANHENQKLGPVVGRGAKLFGGNYFVGSSVGGADEITYPYWQLFDHVSGGGAKDWLQDSRVYEEGGTVWIYAKWSFQQPSTIRLFKGSYSTTAPPTSFWVDRRPITSLFIGGATKTSTNPRGYQTASGSPDFLGAGFAAAKASLLSYVSNKLDSADMFSPRPQAVMVWDLEGEEFSQSFTYVGAPQLLAVVSPEMDSMADDLMATIRARGYEPGITLRPHKIQSGSGRPTNACAMQDANDGQVYIDTSASYPNRGYRCGNAAVTFSGTTADVSGAGVLAVNYQSGSIVKFYSDGGTLPTLITQGTAYYLCSWNNSAQTFSVATSSGCTPLSLSGSSGANHIESWRGPIDLWLQEMATDSTDVYNVLAAKIDYARSRWGIKYFYIDSTYYCTDAPCRTSTVIGNDIWALLHAAYPVVLFMPENSPGGPDTGKFLSFNNGEYHRDSTILATYPGYFVVPYINDTTPGYLDWRATIRAEMAAGVPYIANINSPPTGATGTRYYGDDLPVAAAANSALLMTDQTGRTHSFSASPGTAYTYPLVMRTYFGATNNLTASTTYCEKRGAVSCWQAGVATGTAVLDLTGMNYYENRYYDFAGGVVSRGAAAGL